jgi:hypothetical protein
MSRLAFLAAIPLPKMVKDILTDDVGNYVPDKLLFVVIGLAFVGFAAWDLAVLKHAFDPVKYGLGGGSVLGGGGAGSWAMSRMQPNKPADGQ